MTNKVVTNNGKKGGLLKGKRHYDKQGKSLGGIKAVVSDAGGKPVELEGGEVIINREASKKYWKELSRINQSAGGGVPIGPPMEEEDPSEQYDKGGVIEFNANHIPNKWILSYAKKIKRDHPEIWDLGGNIFGNEAFENLKRVAERGYWLDSEEWMYKKWRSYVARHIHDFRIEGVVAMLKWVDKVEKGWAYMKNLIEAEIDKKASKKMKEGGGVNDKKYSSKKEKGIVFIYENGEKYGYLKTNYSWNSITKKDTPYVVFIRISDNKYFKTNYVFQKDAFQFVKDTGELFFDLNEDKMSIGGELSKGIKAEHEHSKTIDKFKREGVTDLDVEKAIAKDHLKEDPHYYSKLEKMEANKMVKGGKLDFNRPSPAVSAQDVPSNAIGYGNSGLLYIASPNSKGVNQWKLADKNGTNLQELNQGDGLGIIALTITEYTLLVINDKLGNRVFALSYDYKSENFRLIIESSWMKQNSGLIANYTTIEQVRQSLIDNLDDKKIQQWIVDKSNYTGDVIMLKVKIAYLLDDWKKAVEKASKNPTTQSNAPKARTTFTISANALNESAKKELGDYRIKTEQEFIDEFGTNWRDEAGWTSTDSMDWLLEKRIIEIVEKSQYENVLDDIENNRNIKSKVDPKIGLTWSISTRAYTLDPIVSSSIEPTNESIVHELNNYRIKTEQEFINEYGADWKGEVGWASRASKPMDWLLNKKLTEIVKKDDYDFILDEVKNKKGFTSTYSNIPSVDPIWNINRNMYMFDPALYSENVATNLGKKPEVKEITNEQLVSKTKRDELFEDYSDLLFLIDNTPPTEVVNMLELKQLAKKIKDEIDLMDLHLKEQEQGAIALIDDLFEASSVEPEHRYDLTPDVNGFAPNGQPTSLPTKLYKWTTTTKFQDWFGDFTLAYNYKNSAYEQVPCSVVVNKNYEPLLVYHGTGGEFSFFKFDQFPAMYFAENIDYSNWFAEQKGSQYGTGDGYVYPFFLNIRNPLDLTMFGIRDVTPDEFIDWMYLQTGMDEEELKVSKALLGPNISIPAWAYLRNSPDMLKVIKEKNIFDGIIYYENNPPQIGTSSYETKAYIIFESNSAKIADPNRHETILSSMRSFYLEKGGKL
jgi:hypothetical protein